MPHTIERSAERLVIYIGESDRWQGKPLYAAILETLKAEGIAGATVVRGIAGFGAHSRIHTAAILRLSEDLPLRIEVIDSTDRINQAVDILTPMVGEGLITLEKLQVLRYTHRYLNPLPSDKAVSKVMTRDVIILNPEMTISQAWEKMLEHQIKALPVVTETGEVVGVLTDEDLLKCCGGLQQRLAVAERLDAATLREELDALRSSPFLVTDVMIKPAITVRETEPLGIAAARMTRHKIKRLPVVNETGKLVGVLSRIDILRQIVDVEPKSRKTEIPSGVSRTIDEIMVPQVPLIQKDDHLASIIATLIENNTHRVIVVDESGRVIGIISDGDVVARVQPQVRKGVLRALMGGGTIEAGDIAAQDLMSPGVLTATPETDVVDAVNMMLAQGRKWLVVVDWQQKPLGLVDRQILLKAISGSSILDNTNE